MKRYRWIDRALYTYAGSCYTEKRMKEKRKLLKKQYTHVRTKKEGTPQNPKYLLFVRNKK